MLRLAMRLLTVLRLVGAVDSAKTAISERVHAAARTAGLLSIAAVLVIIGVFFVCVAAMLALATVWPMHWAALTVGGVLIAGAGLVLLAIRESGGSRSQKRPTRPAAPGRRVAGRSEATVDWSDMLRPVEDWARQNPGKAAFGAVSLGVLVGLLTGRRTDDKDDT